MEESGICENIGSTRITEDVKISEQHTALFVFPKFIFDAAPLAHIRFGRLNFSKQSCDHWGAMRLYAFLVTLLKHNGTRNIIKDVYYSSTGLGAVDPGWRKPDDVTLPAYFLEPTWVPPDGMEQSDFIYFVVDLKNTLAILSELGEDMAKLNAKDMEQDAVEAVDGDGGGENNDGKTKKKPKRVKRGPGPFAQVLSHALDCTKSVSGTVRYGDLMEISKSGKLQLFPNDALGNLGKLVAGEEELANCMMCLFRACGLKVEPISSAAAGHNAEPESSTGGIGMDTRHGGGAGHRGEDDSEEDSEPLTGAGEMEDHAEHGAPAPADSGGEQDALPGKLYGSTVRVTLLPKHGQRDCDAGSSSQREERSVDFTLTLENFLSISNPVFGALLKLIPSELVKRQVLAAPGVTAGIAAGEAYEQRMEVGDEQGLLGGATQAEVDAEIARMTELASGGRTVFRFTSMRADLHMFFQRAEPAGALYGDWSNFMVLCYHDMTDATEMNKPGDLEMLTRFFLVEQGKRFLEHAPLSMRTKRLEAALLVYDIMSSSARVPVSIKNMMRSFKRELQSTGGVLFPLETAPYIFKYRNISPTANYVLHLMDTFEIMNLYCFHSLVVIMLMVVSSTSSRPVKVMGLLLPPRALTDARTGYPSGYRARGGSRGDGRTRHHLRPAWRRQELFPRHFVFDSFLPY
jgi:hypothetical protein